MNGYPRQHSIRLPGLRHGGCGSINGIYKMEQILVFGAALFGLAAYSPDGPAIRAVLATTIVWMLARFAFWIGYHRSAAMRGLGAPGMALSMIVLLYVAARIGYDVGGFVGATIPVVAFLVIEAFLFRATRPSD